MLEKNELISDKLYVGDFKLTKIYNAFNSHENVRVIKSYHHRKKVYGNNNINNEDNYEKGKSNK